MNENSLHSTFQESLAVGLNLSIITQAPEGDDITTKRLMGSCVPALRPKSPTCQIRSKTSLDVDL
jgi:hypothetical protein